MPLPSKILEEMGARRAEEAVAARRATTRDLAWTAVQCVLWVALGLLLIGWSMHTTDPVLGGAAFYAGIGLGNGGWVFTVLAAYARGEERGDW